MYRVGFPFPGIANGTRVYSPVTLSREWPTLSRLIFIVFWSFLGSIINGFFVASFFVEHALKRLGNVFHACVGMADLILSAAVMPISAVVLLSGQWDINPVCQVVQVLTEASTYCYSLFFTLVAAENYFRICCESRTYDMFLSMPIGLVTIIVFMVSFIMAGVGTFLDLDYDYCQRLHFGDSYFRTATSVIFYVIPFLFTSYCLLYTCIEIRSRARLLTAYKRSRIYRRDYSVMNLNVIAYMFFVVFWIPYLIIIHFYPSTTDNKYYHTAWLGVGRSLITSGIYCSLDRSFRRAFAHLFYYCCCKSTLNGPFNNRHRRILHYKYAAGDVRVHIMHQVVNNTPQSATTASRETREL